MNLVLLDGEFAVCRLPPDAAVPNWAWHGAWASVTRTTDELSTACPASAFPGNVVHERGWCCLGVLGPLDFSLTGILASLAVPLAEAAISPFAVSTFDTDYLLVKRDSLEPAVRALEGSEDTVSGFRAGGTP